MLSRLRLSLVALIGLAALAVALPSQAAPAKHHKRKHPKVKKLYGRTGPGYDIRLTNYHFVPIKRLKRGRYTFVIQDRSTLHDFHLVGPGVDKKTPVRFFGTKTWKKVRLRRGKYRYFCDVHRKRMHGSFVVR